MIIKIDKKYYDTLNGDFYSYKPTDVDFTETWIDDHKYVGIRTEPDYVQSLDVVPTLNCNFRCTYCMENSTEGHQDLNLNSFKNVFDDALFRYLGHLIKNNLQQPGFQLRITGGGEPTYNWELFKDIIDYSRGTAETLGVVLNIIMTTNGCLNAEQRAYISKNINQTMISYDGLPEIQMRNRPTRCENGYRTVEETISSMVNAGSKVVIRTVIYEKDYERMKEMLDHLYCLTDLKKAAWSIMPVQSKGRAVNNNPHINKVFYDYYSELQKYALEKYGALNISSPIFDISPRNCSCGRIFNNHEYWLKPDNLLYACIECPLNPIGAVVDDCVGFENDYHDLLKETYSGTYASERCRSCLSYIVCRGGCPAFAINHGVDSDEYTIQCKNRVLHWKGILDRLLTGEEVNGWRITSTSDPNKEHLEYINKSKEQNYGHIVMNKWSGPNTFNGVTYDIECGIIKSPRMLIKLKDGRVLYLMDKDQTDD